MPKINAKHKPLYTSQKRFVYEKGGRGSSKSYTVTDYCIRISYSANRVILFMRYTMMSASISIVPEFQSHIEELGCEADFNIVGSTIHNLKSGSKIIFKGVKTSSLNQTANLKSIHGLTDVIYDEFEEHPDQASFDKLDESIRTTSATNKIVLVSNALHKKSWQYKAFWDDTGIYYDMTEHIFTTWRDNKENLSDSWHQKRKLVELKDPKKYARDYDGKDYDELEGALWKQAYFQRFTVIPQLKRVVISVDPAVTSSKDSDEHGILAIGLGYDNKAYVLEDVTNIYTPNGMAQAAINLYYKYEANTIIGEVNNGGDFIETVIKNIDNGVAYKSVRASRGKAIRAEPVVNLYEQGLVLHKKDGLEALEVELTSWNPQTDSKSPNRLDSVVWGLTELMLGKRSNLPPVIW